MNDIDITKRSERVNIFYLRRFTKEIHFYVSPFETIIVGGALSAVACDWLNHS